MSDISLDYEGSSNSSRASSREVLQSNTKYFRNHCVFRIKREDREAEVTVDAMTSLCGNQKSKFFIIHLEKRMVFIIKFAYIVFNSDLRTVVAVPVDRVGPAQDLNLLVQL